MSDDFFEDLNDLTHDSDHSPEPQDTPDVEVGLSKLAALVEDINRDLTVSTILERAMTAAIELTGAERGFLVLVTESGQWDFRVARNMGTKPNTSCKAASGNRLVAGQDTLCLAHSH